MAEFDADLFVIGAGSGGVRADRKSFRGRNVMMRRRARPLMSPAN